MNKTITLIALGALMLLITITPALATSSENDEQALAFGSEQDDEPENRQFDIKPLVVLIIIGAIALWNYKKLYK